MDFLNIYDIYKLRCWESIEYIPEKGKKAMNLDQILAKHYET